MWLSWAGGPVWLAFLHDCLETGGVPEGVSPVRCSRCYWIVPGLGHGGWYPRVYTAPGIPFGRSIWADRRRLWERPGISARGATWLPGGFSSGLGARNRGSSRGLAAVSAVRTTMVECAKQSTHPGFLFAKKLPPSTLNKFRYLAIIGTDNFLSGSLIR